MSTPETKPPTPRPDAPASPLIPVRSLTFQTDNRVDLPAQDQKQLTSIRASEPSPKKFIRIFYDARLRHHRVEVFEPGPDPGRRPVHVRYIPEGWCSWEPA